jgi:hypothetical protein
MPGGGVVARRGSRASLRTLGKSCSRFHNSLAPNTGGTTMASSDSPDSFERHESSGRSGWAPAARDDSRFAGVFRDYLGVLR